MKGWLLNPEVREVWQRGAEAPLLDAYERVWERKAILREIYETWYRLITKELKDGNLVEIGAGTGNFKRWVRPRACWSLDILPGKWVDLQADAMRLPLRPGSVDNLVMIDALHHLARPKAFLAGAAEALRPGGRLLCVEPFVSAWGWFVYKFIHHEGMSFQLPDQDDAKAAWEGNAAIPQMVLADDGPARAGLRVISIRYLEFLSYPLSGGFSYRELLPLPILRGLRRLEQGRLFQNRVMALRLFAVLERAA